jgi:hypothetical protein
MSLKKWENIIETGFSGGCHCGFCVRYENVDEYIDNCHICELQKKWGCSCFDSQSPYTKHCHAKGRNALYWAMVIYFDILDTRRKQ